ncbi:hypothetical protein WM46_03255 [Citrobacter freundii complex sp. CFNIH2]|uniref:hypothetical protein n=1 Tax=Citrobacter freundii complex sp. CFNIH2 TaxID=2066049 RepID=UPI000CA3527C|nr:hypothetical protein [Citrobacter freundii complex sp. CFNIH2]AUO63848.1 hypothetical protein WM46_03255 [Citrobacter freundii complex sp. CFNIH2]
MAKKPFIFAHLLGRGATAASEEEEDKKAKGRRAEEEEEENAEEEEEETTEEEEETTSEEDKEDAADDDEDDRKESKSARQARISERKRCARIFSSPHAAANPALAASLAFNTGMSSAAAINVMASQAPAVPPKRGRSLDERMQDSQQVRLNPDGGQKESGKSTLVSKMTGLYNSTRGDK